MKEGIHGDIQKPPFTSKLGSFTLYTFIGYTVKRDSLFLID